ncbi:ABC-type cobalamin/Fe3+-siderophore transport system, ATPase component [Aequorivita sublithincola DSM 14238]|uniref:ABC-type cobalamin/Fe3+-siderophore transport system, ATPase component n=1 Tax=Aequorivita sublithincola (strain DSM 14238 / LMG 21431 / ACAM 643 / 9-3) TaxID=746697 RepID=I3YTF1_AEQSU|nr:heme ABC transporter ATP-binding protein [Aequorivita sublithincola]AFL80269.1 ABC-type cobalamin/Fe3+-siderophore transport system, ATPase component [Aequorivita sublithincola DSM 14238]
MIQANNITFKIGKKTILKDISINFEPGKINLILGPNGAGKSTLVKVICNQLKPQDGMVFYEGIDIKNTSVAELAKVRAVLSQNTELAFPLKVKEVVTMGRYPHFSVNPTSKDEQAIQEAMQFFDVEEMADRDYLTLSGGEKQRVHFARVVSQIWYPSENGCRYLILDEPLTFLDVHYQFQFMHKLSELLKQQDLVIVGVVHDLNLAAKFADHLVLLNNGELLASGTKEEVLNKENMKTAYRLEPVIHNDERGMYLFFE